ncbi:D-tyrosyl-tRNA deacylase [Trichoderma reesei QM6a]|uniref:D-aminoacyl-tRNA deacylase n=1 Tax=Hypocrea jecorina (strain QM6a) TaxID=431241 RepID=G0RUX0_HYPJQ|nr:D-tyrosyl-tRNA deacylase [Trichoderma reesei QM6a]EGR45136.1 D-tyrosyl-tRNA deacylase [Trichoderma reesei QM6a]
MKAIIQRVLSASVTVEKELVSSIGRGVLVFAAVAPGDTEKEADSLANKVVKMKLWDDEQGGRWKRSVTDIEGEVLCVSQFTLLAKTKKGTKPDFHGAASPEEASRLYRYFVQRVKDMYQVDRVKDGKFQAMMEVALVNDGPTIPRITSPATTPPDKSSLTHAMRDPLQLLHALRPRARPATHLCSRC